MVMPALDLSGQKFGYLNCRWATMREQGRNKRDTVMVQTPIGTLPLAEVAERFGLK